MQPVLTSLAVVRAEDRLVGQVVVPEDQVADHQEAPQEAQAAVQAVPVEVHLAVQEVQADHQAAQAVRHTATVFAQPYAAVLVSRILRRPAVLVPALAFHRVLRPVIIVVIGIAVFRVQISVSLAMGCV